jgi:predicted ATPase
MQKIIVKNFRQISHAEIDIKKLLVLVGEQASGKSTLAKLIYFFKSLKDDYFDLVYKNADSSVESLKSTFIGIIQDKFKIYFGYTTELEDTFEVVFHYNFVAEDSNKNMFLRLSKIGSLNVKFGNSYFRQISNSTRTIAQEIVSFTRQQNGANQSNYKVIEQTKARFINDLVNSVNELFYDKYAPQFFPAGRNITVSFPEQFQASFLSALPSANPPPKSVDLVLMKSFIFHSKFLIDYFKGRDFSNNILENGQAQLLRNTLAFFIEHTQYILQGKYSNADGTEKIVYNGSESSNVTLNVASSGQQEAIRIIQDLLYILLENQKSFRIMEEPEAHLYPKAQKNMMELMALVINKTESQIIITTHSPYVLSILNNLLMYSVVLAHNPNAHTAIKEHFGTKDLDASQNEKINLTANQVQAYSLSNQREKYCSSIINAETGLIGDNFLDNFTEELNNDFNTLYNLRFQNQ